MFTRWNACPVKCLFLFHWRSMLHAPCAMLALPLGSGNSLSRYPIKLHQLREGMEFFRYEQGSVSQNENGVFTIGNPNLAD